MPFKEWISVGGVGCAVGWDHLIQGRRRRDKWQLGRMCVCAVALFGCCCCCWIFLCYQMCLAGNKRREATHFLQESENFAQNRKGGIIVPEESSHLRRACRRRVSDVFLQRSRSAFCTLFGSPQETPLISPATCRYVRSFTCLPRAYDSSNAWKKPR